MIRQWPFFTAVGLACLELVLVGQPDSGELRRVLQSLYDRAGVAMLTARTPADLDEVRDWLDTPDCVYTDFGRPARSWSEERAFAMEDLRTPLTTFSTTIESVQRDASHAVVTAIVRGTARILDATGRFGASGVTHEIETTATIRDEWVQTAGTWRRKSHTKIVGNAVTAIDGKRTVGR